MVTWLTCGYVSTRIIRDYCGRLVWGDAYRKPKRSEQIRLVKISYQ